MATDYQQPALEGMDGIVPQQPASVRLSNIIDRAAFDPNFAPEKLLALYELVDRARKEEARLAYVEAMRQFRANPPRIEKTKHVKYATSSGAQVDYWHAELDKAVDIITEALRAVGIHHTFASETIDGKPTVTCVLTHRLGHSERASTLSGPPDKSGAKNDVQAVGSTSYYLQRYTLFMATGIVPEGADTDGVTREGLSEATILDYCTNMRDAASFDELKRAYEEARDAAKKIRDTEAYQRFVAVKDARKKELAGAL